MQKSSYLLLFLAVSIILGYAYSLDIPQALEVQLRKEPYNFTTTNFNLMYFFTFLSVGLFGMPIGIIVDRIPIKKTMYILLFLSLASQLTTALMFEFLPKFYIPVIFIMRSIFGMAGQSMFSLQCTIVSLFGQKDYEIIMGFGLSAPFMFDAVNAVITPVVYDATQNLPLTWYIGTLVCAYSILAAVYLNKKIIKEQQPIQEQKNTHTQTNKNQSCFKELKKLNFGFWLIIAAIFFFECSLGPVNDNLNELLVERFGISYTDAGKLLLTHFMLLPFLSFIFSYYLKKLPQIRRMSIVVSSLAYLFAHLSVYFLPNCTQPTTIHYLVIIAFLITLSFNFSIYYVSLTASITFMIQQSVLGTGWGIAASAIGIAQCLVPLAFIQIIDSNSDLSISYKDLNLFTTLLAVIPFLLALWIYFGDYKVLDQKLMATQSDRKNQETSSSLQEQILGNQK